VCHFARFHATANSRIQCTAPSALDSPTLTVRHQRPGSHADPVDRVPVPRVRDGVVDGRVCCGLRLPV